MLFSSEAHREAYIEQEAKARLPERVRDLMRAYLLSHPELTPEEVAALWARVTISVAAECSRDNPKRRAKRKPRTAR